MFGLVLTAVLLGPASGLGLFGAWYWLTPPLERVDADAGWYLGWFTGLGAFAGSMAAVVVWLAASGRRRKG